MANVFQSIFIPTITYCHEPWVRTKKVQSQMQAFEIKFLQKIKGITMFEKDKIKFLQKINEITMFDKDGNTAIGESLNIESLLL